MFKVKQHKEYLRLQEISKLNKKFKTHTKPSSSEYMGIEKGVAYWRVKTIKNEVTLCWPIFGMDVGPQSDNFIVHVDAFLFYKKWLEGTLVDQLNRSINCHIKSQMPIDKKFKNAVAVLEKPNCVVPLAKVTIEKLFGEERIFFIDGVTRTFWLLFNEAQSFPILVNGKDKADKLHEFAGVGETPIPCQNLLNTVNDEYQIHLNKQEMIKGFYS